MAIILRLKPLNWLFISLFFIAAAIIVALQASASSDIEDSVFRVLAIRDNGPSGTGSSFLVADNSTLVTNYHVVRGAGELIVLYDKDDRIFSTAARVRWFDGARDLAILQTEEALPGLVSRLADISEDQLEKRDEVTAIGFPGAADDLADLTRRSFLDSLSPNLSFVDATVSTGTVQRIVPSATRLMIQHSANVNSGNSGGPLFDACDRVIGVNTLSQVAEIDAERFIDSLVRDGSVRFQTPGALEFSVHVSEVLAAMRGEGLRTFGVPGRCRAGFDRNEIFTVSALGGLALAALAFFGISVAHFRATPGGLPPLLNDSGASVGGYPTHAPEPPEPEGIYLVLEPLNGGPPISLEHLASTFAGDGVLVGRDSAKVDLVVEDGSVSRVHARISRYGEQAFVINDLDSSNGTSIDGSPASQAQARELIDGSILALGNLEFAVRLQLSASALPLVPTALGAGVVHDQQSSWLLSAFDENGQRAEHTMASFAQAPNTEITIGRDPSRHFVVHASSVSRRHAILSFDQSGALVLRDTNSSNGTRVDGRKIGNEPVAVSPQSKIMLGDVEIHLSVHHG